MSVIERDYYHTQEKRAEKLKQPVKSLRSDCWLGYGWYFWEILDFAKAWGIQSKNKTGNYEIYKARIKSSYILDTVFNREEYTVYSEMLDEIGRSFFSGTQRLMSKRAMNDYLQEKSDWEIEGILFADTPTNQRFSLIKNLFYRKRIQLVIFKLELVKSFELVYTSASGSRFARKALRRNKGK